MKAETPEEYLNRWLKEHKLTAVEIERRSGGAITDGYIGQLKRGQQKNLTVDKLIALARAMGDNPHNLLDVFMGEAVPESTDPWPSHMLLSALQRMVNDPILSDIMKALLQMDAKELKTVRKSLAKPKRSR
jgi:transcriptional regulator with XRE-family HTH domain